MKQLPLIGALPIIAKMLGRKLGVEVVIGAPKAATDGKTIYLPALPLDDPTVAILANGYIDHEAAHVRFSDWTLPQPAGPLERRLVNILEDVRIERALGRRYPGTRANLNRLVTAMTERGEFATPPAATPLARAVLSYLLHRLRAEVLGQTTLTALAEHGETQIRQALSPGVVVKLHALAFEVVNAASTADVMQLARRIIAMLQDEADQAIGDPATADSPSDANPSCGDLPGADRMRAADTATSLRSLLGASDVDCGAVGDLGSQVATLLDARAKVGAASVVMAEYDRAPDNAGAAMLASQAHAATTQLRRRLASLVQASRETDAWRSRRGRRLHGRDLYRLRVNDPMVFTQKDEQPAPETAVYLLLDRSRSMHRVIELAARAALATAIALEAIPGITVAVSAFPGSGEDRLLPLVGFGERSRTVAGRFRIGAWGGTPLQDALWRAGFDLLGRREPRRLVLIVTDGDPQNVPGTGDVIARCRASGTEVLGLGIDARETVLQLFGPASAVSIDDIRQLAPALFRLLEQQLARHAA